MKRYAVMGAHGSRCAHWGGVPSSCRRAHRAERSSTLHPDPSPSLIPLLISTKAICPPASLTWCVLSAHTFLPRILCTLKHQRAIARKQENRNGSKILQFADVSPVFSCSLMKLIWRRRRESDILLLSNSLTSARSPVEHPV